VDRNGNGDLTAEDKKVPRGKAQGQAPGYFACGDIVQADGKTICTGLTVSGSAEEGDMSVAINLDGKHGQSAAVDANGYLQFADSPDRAPIIHFDGQLTMSVIPLADIYITATLEKKGDKVEVISKERTVRVFWPTFVLGGEKAELRVAVGTAGEGKGTFSRLHYKEIADGVHPVASIGFPNRDPAKGAIKIKLALPKRC